MEDHEQDRELGLAPALIAVHPTRDSVAVAVGSDLRVFDLKDGCPLSLVDDSNVPFHKDSIRAIRYGVNLKLFASAGDDKLVKIWSTDSWRCIYTVLSEKRVSAVALSNDGHYVCYADKFGVVWAVDLLGLDENQALVDNKPTAILSHYCSIITSLEFTPDGRFIISADRDFKIRVTVFPDRALGGAHDIQSFCLGHTEFVSCLAFVCSPEYPQGLLLSGSGDSTVRLWDYTSGCLLDTCEVGAKAGLAQPNQREGDEYPAVTDLCTTSDGLLFAVAIQSLPGIMLLSCDLSARTLSIAKVVSISTEDFIPTRLATTTSSAEELWMVMGVSSLHGSSGSACLARVGVISGFNRRSLESAEDEQPRLLEDKEIPCGEQLLQKLQGTLSIDQEMFTTAAEAVKTAMSNLLIKKQYSTERRDFRKRGRNDKKIKQ